MRSFIVMMVLVGFISCKEQLIAPPQNLIPQEKMTEILYDLAIIKGMRSTSIATLDKYAIETMPYLYKKYNIDSLQFVESDRYYASVPTIYQTMYQSIADRLDDRIKEIDEARKQKNDSAQARNKRIRDSLGKKALPTNSPVPLKK